MTDLPDFTKNSCPENSSVVDTHRSPHEILRRAIDALEPGEQIVLSVQVAMGLIMEWKELEAALREMPLIVLNWSNNLAKEYNESQKKVRIYGDPAYQHTDHESVIADFGKKYAAEVLANAYAVCRDKVEAALSGRGESK